MLQRLHISNYAIINEVVIDFPKALNVITGETGAGKSILMGALSLILGERADTSMLLNREKKCVIEGTFITNNKKEITAFLTENELEISSEIILRREIATTGKTRAFINDTPVNIGQLKQFASYLVDLHRQFDTLELNEENFQREVIDALANTQSAVNEYRQTFTGWQQAKSQLDKLINQKSEFNKEADYNKFLYDELAELNLQTDELETLDQELKLLSSAEEIKAVLTSAAYTLYESEAPVVQQLKQLINQLSTYKAYHSKLPELTERLNSAAIELQDIADETESIKDSINSDEERLHILNEKLAAGYKLQKKHNVNSTNELISIQAELEEKLQAVLAIDETIAVKQKEAETLYTKALQQSETISQQRRKVIPTFEKNVNILLTQVGMPNANIKVEISASTLNSNGADTIEFLFDANNTKRFEPLHKVASGGELSRLMLCIKSLVAKQIDLPTMIFDEIDTGISGEAAKQVGNIMKELAANRQIICITHQPQIAGKAEAHFFVYKEIVNDAVKTNIRLLNNDERITAIAKMLSGEKPTAAALENAREMIMN